MSQADDIDAMQIGPDPDKLFVYHRQQLSAMLDGELSPDEAKFMLRRLQHDTELATCWERWQVCGDVLRGRRDALLPADFAERVARAVAGGRPASAAVPAQAPRAARKPRLARWGGGAAMAASVALLAVFAGRQLPDPAPAAEGAGPTPIVAASAAAASSPNVAVATTGAPDAAADAGDRQPAPASPIQDASGALAAAVAVAEVPRRAAERRSRAQSQRAASRVQSQRRAEAPVALAVNAPAVRMPDAGIATPAAEGHFAMPPAATVAARPWPRALLPAGDSAFTVGFGQVAREPGFEPFRPREVAGPATGPVGDGMPRAEPGQGSPTWP